MKKTKSTQGRNPFTKIEKARSEAIKAYIRLHDVESEYNATLGLMPEDMDTDYGRAVMQVAEERMEMTEDLEQTNDAISKYTKLQREGVELTEGQEKEYQELRDHRSEILEVFDMTPDLGSSYGDWAEASEDLKKRDIGRPKQSIEVQLYRARQAYQEAATQLHSSEKRKKQELTDIEAMAKEEMNKPRRPGRPKKDPITVLREKMVSTEERLMGLESGVANKEYQEKLDRAPRNETGKIIGRPPVDPQLKYDDLREDFDATQHQMEFMLREYDNQLADKARLSTFKSRISMLKKFIEVNAENCTAKGLKLVRSRLNDLQNSEIELVNAMSSQVLSSVDTKDAKTENELKQKGEQLNKMLEDARKSRSPEKRDKLIDESEALLNEFGLAGKVVNQ